MTRRRAIELPVAGGNGRVEGDGEAVKGDAPLGILADGECRQRERGRERKRRCIFISFFVRVSGKNSRGKDGMGQW